MKITLSASRLALALLAFSACAVAQQTTDLRTNVATWPYAQSASFPGRCGLGQMLQVVLSPPYAPQVYECGYSNDWNLQGAGSGGGLADPGANGPMKRTALNVTAPATGADIATLFGCSSGSPLLTYTGGCAANGAATPAGSSGNVQTNNGAGGLGALAVGTTGLTAAAGTLDVDLTKVPSRPIAAQGLDTTCLDSGATGAPTSSAACAPTGNAITYALAAGMLLKYTPVTTTAGGAMTLNANGTAVPVLQSNCTSNPTTSQWAATVPALLEYNYCTASTEYAWVVLLPAVAGATTKLNEQYIPLASASVDNTAYPLVIVNGGYPLAIYSDTLPTLTLPSNGNSFIFERLIPQNWTGALTLRVPVGVLAGYNATNVQTSYAVACFNPAVAGAPSFNAAATVTDNFTSPNDWTVDVPSPVLTGCVASTGSNTYVMLIQVIGVNVPVGLGGTLFTGVYTSLPSTM